MNKSLLDLLWRAWVACMMVAAAPCLTAQTKWTGPTTNFTHAAAGGAADQLTAGVILTRGSSGGLYNSVTETSAVAGTSPKDTQWAIGSLANYNTLTYGACPLEAGHSPAQYDGKTFVVHLVNENIYLSLTLTAWGGQGGSPPISYSYTRSTPAVVPTVSITNPVAGSVFSAPVALKLGASASVSSGTVTNVSFFATNATSTNLLGSVQTSPFKVTGSGLGAGNYSLYSVAAAGGVSATSAVVNISVVTPVAVSNSASSINGTIFSFGYSANAGLSYVVQSSADLVNWASLATNTAAGTPVVFSNSVTPNAAKFYRVGRLPNP